MGRLVLIIALLLLPCAAQAQYLVDTGTPNELSSLWAAGSSQSLASRFDLAAPATVTSLEGYFLDSRDAYFFYPGNVTVSLYRGTAFDLSNPPLAIPDVSSRIFTDKFAVSIATHNDGRMGNWYGVDGLGLNLGPGSYWLAFGASGDTYDGGMPSASPNPLATAAYAYPAYPANTYVGKYGSFLDNGVRVGGSAAPEPVSTALFLIGGGALTAIKRFRRGR
jgi:hypothetical protein